MLGNEAPTSDSPTLSLSTHLPFRSAAINPSNTPEISHSTAAPVASQNVGQNDSVIATHTWRPFCRDRSKHGQGQCSCDPVLPSSRPFGFTRPDMYRPYCLMSGSSNP